MGSKTIGKRGTDEEFSKFPPDAQAGGGGSVRAAGDLRRALGGRRRLFRDRGGGPGQQDVQVGAAAERGSDVEVPSQQLGALPHADQSHGGGVPAGGADVAADAVVLHAQDQAFVRGG